MLYYNLELEEDRITLLTDKDKLPIEKIVLHTENGVYIGHLKVNNLLGYTFQLTKKDLYTLKLTKEVQNNSMQQLKPGQKNKQSFIFQHAVQKRLQTQTSIFSMLQELNFTK